VSQTSGARYRVPLVVAAVAAAISIISACSVATSGAGLQAAPGASSFPSSGPSSSSGSSPSSGSDGQSGTAPTEAQLESIVLRDGDLPEGWVNAGADTSGNDSDNGDAAKVPACAGLDATDNDQLNEADSSEYQLGQANIDSDASSFKEPADIVKDTNYILSPQFLQCADAIGPSQIDASLNAGEKVTKFVASLTRSSTPANLIATMHAQITVAASGQTVVEYIDTAYIIGPQIEASVTYGSANAPLSAALEAQVSKLVASRAAVS
jgi:hypothetical protein